MFTATRHFGPITRFFPSSIVFSEKSPNGLFYFAYKKSSVVSFKAGKRLQVEDEVRSFVDLVRTIYNSPDIYSVEFEPLIEKGVGVRILPSKVEQQAGFRIGCDSTLKTFIGTYATHRQAALEVSGRTGLLFGKLVLAKWDTYPTIFKQFFPNEEEVKVEVEEEEPVPMDIDIDSVDCALLLQRLQLFPPEAVPIGTEVTIEVSKADLVACMVEPAPKVFEIDNYREEPPAFLNDPLYLAYLSKKPTDVSTVNFRYLEMFRKDIADPSYGADRADEYDPLFLVAAKEIDHPFYRAWVDSFVMVDDDEDFFAFP